MGVKTGILPTTAHVAPSSGSRNKPSKKPAELSLPPAFTLVSCSGCSTLKMEEICFSETITDYTALYPRK
jgi:hypothetical protein